MSPAIKLRYWLDSVHGLRSHVAVYRAMMHAARDLSPQDWPDPFREQLHEQERMIGNCVLHVLLVHPLGSGRFW